MKFATTLLLLAVTGCTTMPDLYESGYYTPGGCSGGLCTLPSPVYGHFPPPPGGGYKSPKIDWEHAKPACIPGLTPGRPTQKSCDELRGK
jgi:hypothetical protein